MVDFYNAVFASGLRPIEGSPLFRGVLADTELMICPNTIAGVRAEQARHQLRIAVQDPDVVAARVVDAGGSILNSASDLHRLVIGVADPDGNTYELVQAEIST